MVIFVWNPPVEKFNQFIELYNLNTVKLNQFKWKFWVLINVYSYVTDTTVMI